MDQIQRSDITDFSTPLEVTYNGESAQDFWGPRRQWQREIRDQRFTKQREEYILMEDMIHITENHFFGAGVYFGQFKTHLRDLSRRIGEGENIGPKHLLNPPHSVRHPNNMKFAFFSEWPFSIYFTKILRSQNAHPIGQADKRIPPSVYLYLWTNP